MGDLFSRQKFLYIVFWRTKVTVSGVNVINRSRITKGCLQVVLYGHNGDVLFLIKAFKQIVEIFLVVAVYARGWFV